MKIEIEHKYSDAIASILRRNGAELAYKGRKGLELPDSQTTRLMQSDCAYWVELGEYLVGLANSVDGALKQ